MRKSHAYPLLNIVWQHIMEGAVLDLAEKVPATTSCADNKKCAMKAYIASVKFYCQMFRNSKIYNHLLKKMDGKAYVQYEKLQVSLIGLCP